MSKEIFSMEFADLASTSMEVRKQRGYYDVKGRYEMFDRFLTEGFELSYDTSEYNKEVFIFPDDEEIHSLIIEEEMDAEELFRKARCTASHIRYDMARRFDFKKDFKILKLSVVIPFDFLGEGKDVYRFYVIGGKMRNKSEFYVTLYSFYHFKEDEIESAKRELYSMQM